MKSSFLGVNIGHRPGLLIVDRNGLVWKHYIGLNTIDIKLQNILKWLEFIEMLCPECGVMDEPAYDKNEMNLSMIKLR